MIETLFARPTDKAIVDPDFLTDGVVVTAAFFDLSWSSLQNKVSSILRYSGANSPCVNELHTVPLCFGVISQKNDLVFDTGRF